MENKEIYQGMGQSLTGMQRMDEETLEVHSG